ncbi:MAG: NADH:ubiquinone oxidoreductase subunit NDUFA12 [Alphaproteobacteria bacterium]|nr:NADH:ubiquinone oxidoreductase subunit NDUFA12 [Alphaproteobacteria bacterium]
MTLGTRLYTMLRGERVGEDSFGNRYYHEKNPDESGQRRKRWVLYKGAAEASKVPADWHAWLHHTIALPPSVAPLAAQPWEQPHRPNATGSPDAYLPRGHLHGTGQRPPATGDYEPWRPN